MDTKERRPRRAPARKPDRRRRPQQAQERSGRRKQPAAPNPSARRPRQTQPPRRQPRQPEQQRVVKAPRRDLPEVTYMMPKPFSRGKFLLKIVTVIAVVIALMSSMSLFFKVEHILVAGTEKYTPYMIREASGIEEGDSLLGISKPQVAGKIIDSLPYVDQVKISRNLPGTVSIAVTELDVTYAIQAVDNSWWLISSDGRVIASIDSTAAAGYTRILGVQAEAPRINQQIHAPATVLPEELPTETQASEETKAPGETAPELAIPTQPQATEADRMAVVLNILDLLEQNEIIGEVASVDVSSMTNLTLEYENRFHVVLGTAENLSYKIAAMTSAVDQLEKYEIGELDVSFKFSEKVIFNPER